MIEVKEDTTTFVELSINSVVGLNYPGTMKVRGKLQDEDVIILIDCGTTHNFVSEKLVKKLLIPIKVTAHYGGILGSGAAVQGKGICEELEICMKDWTVKENVLPLELGGVDIILVKGKPIQIQGDPSLTKARVSLKNMIKAWGAEDEGFLVECRVVELVTPVNNDYRMTYMEIETDSSLSTVLKQFEDVFEWPEKLPPRREIEHQIHLKQGTDPINVRPYRYGFQQKEETEKLVKEMLESRVIRPSNINSRKPLSLQNDVLKYKDRLRKYGHFLPRKHSFTAKVVVELFIKEVVRLHGFPLSIISDRDKIFLSHFWQELFRVSGTRLNKSTTYHPQTDGQTEVVNRGVETYLRCFCNEKPKEWVVCGRKPPALLSYGSMQSKNSTVEEMLQERDEILSALRDHLRLAQEQMKDYAD
ncbi:ty3-gypsy retroelement transposase [Cucumis melo var. makuwa]|uniref:Ty3-gypsy retroelement transposase n=1 Tax=Cucumis melo var. makuwa TaxID=1194695 RepID=A0A5D3CI15_CUCMM|nr:ty3-gypsy retroelement transposase [Cucumis melo var. makuwa]